MRRATLYLLGPTVVVLLLAILPLALGKRILIHSDTLNLHLGLKAGAASSLAAGELPLVDMVRTTGEPLLGNANGLPLYPTNLLYLVAPLKWAFNAHYWLHWLLAPFAFYWLARAFRLGPGGAAAGATFWATSGFFLSQLNFYNLVALMAVAPAFVASWLAAAEKPKYWALSAILLALLILAGDPFSALLALGMGALALFFRPGTRGWSWRGALGSMAAALLLAAPGVVELIRIVPTSLRHVANRDPGTSLEQSFPGVGFADLVLPFFLGDFDMTFWGKRYFEGSLPFFPTLFPGVLAIAAAIAGSRRGGGHRRAATWSLLLLGGGVFFALGAGNPLVALLYQHLPGFSVLRFPVKFMLPPMLAVCLLGGIGFDRFLSEGEPARRALSRTLGALTAFYLLALALLILLPAPLERWLRALEPVLLAGAAFDLQRARWSATLLVLVAVGALAWLCAQLARKPTASAGLVAAGLMLALGSVVQLELLEQLYTGADAALLDEPPALAAVPESSLIYHRTRNSLRLVNETLPPELADGESDVLMARCMIAELAPEVGPFWHRRYALSQTLDYLDSYLGFYVSWKLGQAADTQALPVLAALGVDRLLSTREIAPESAPQVELLGRFPSPCRRELFVYRLLQAAPGSYQFPGNIRRVANLDGGFASLSSRPIDPGATVVLSGQGDVEGRPPGTIRVLAEEADAFELEVESAAGGVVVARRTWLPFYRAFVDGRPARLEVANLMHLGLELPAGRHHVRVEADRRPTRAAFAASGLTLLALLVAFFKLRDNEKGGSEDPPSSAAPGAATIA